MFGNVLQIFIFSFSLFISIAVPQEDLEIGRPLNNSDGVSLHASEEGESQVDPEDGEPINDEGNGDPTYVPKEGELQYDQEHGGPPHDLGVGEPPYDPGEGELQYDPGDGGPSNDIGDGGLLEDLGEDGPPYDPREGESQYDPGVGASPNDQGTNWQSDNEDWENQDMENAPLDNDVDEFDDEFDSEQTQNQLHIPDSSEILNRNKPEPGFDLSHEEIIKLKLWPDALVLYYIDVHSFSDKVMRDRIRSFLSSVNSLTSLNFVELPSPPSDDSRWVMFLNRRGLLGCADHSIRNFTNSGVQRVVLGYHCMSSEGELAEAVLAIAGVPAQHNSPDRDYYIQINEENIIPEKKFLFEKRSDDEWLFHDIEYDFKSVGHFHSYKHSINGRPTIEPQKDTGDLTIGESKALTASDILKIRMLYNYIVKKKLLEAPDCYKLFKPGKKFGQYIPSDTNLAPRPKPFRYIGESPDAPLVPDDIKPVPDQNNYEEKPDKNEPYNLDDEKIEDNNGVADLQWPSDNEDPGSQFEEYLPSQNPDNQYDYQEPYETLPPNYEANFQDTAPFENISQKPEESDDTEHFATKDKKPAIVNVVEQSNHKVTLRYDIDDQQRLLGPKQEKEPPEDHLAMIQPLTYNRIQSKTKKPRPKDPLSALTDYQTDEEKKVLGLHKENQKHFKGFG